MEWHKYFENVESLPKRKRKKLTEQEHFCLWYLSELPSSIKKDVNIHSMIYKASQDIYLSPVFDDLLDVDYAITALQEKGYITLKTEPITKTVH